MQQKTLGEWCFKYSSYVENILQVEHFFVNRMHFRFQAHHRIASIPRINFLRTMESNNVQDDLKGAPKTAKLYLFVSMR